MRAALVANGIVVNTILVGPNYQPPAGHTLVPSETAAIGDTYANGAFTRPPPPPLTKPDMIAYAENAKWRKETGGIAVNGIAVATDDRSKLMIAGARIKAADDPTWTTQWHIGGGVLVPITAEQVIAFSDAVLAHVDACFATFGTVVAAIEAGAITTTAEIDAAFE